MTPLCGRGKSHADPHSFRRFDVNRAAGGGHPLAHAGKPVPLSQRSADAVVLNRHDEITIVDTEHDSADGRSCVPHDVGHRLAQRQRQYRLLPRRAWHWFYVDVEADARRAERLLGAPELAREASALVTLDRPAHFRESFTRHALDVSDLRHRTGRIAVGELGGELGLERNNRQRMSEEIVEIAGDALALRDFGHLFHLFPRPPDEGVLALAVADEQVAHADHEDEKDGPSADNQPARTSEERHLHSDAASQYQKHCDRTARSQRERHQRRRVDYVRRRGDVERKQSKAECGHEDQLDERARRSYGAVADEIEVEVGKRQQRRKRERPYQPSAVCRDWTDEDGERVNEL